MRRLFWTTVLQQKGLLRCGFADTARLQSTNMDAGDVQPHLHPRFCVVLSCGLGLSNLNVTDQQYMLRCRVADSSGNCVDQRARHKKIPAPISSAFCGLHHNKFMLQNDDHPLPKTSSPTAVSPLVVITRFALPMEQRAIARFDGAQAGSENCRLHCDGR